MRLDNGKKFSNNPAPAPSPVASLVSRLAVLGAIGFIPFLLVPGLNHYTLTPRTIFLQLCIFLITTAWFFRPQIKTSAFYLPAFLFMAILALSTLWAVNPYRTTTSLSKHISLFLLFLATYNLLSLKDLPHILRINAIALGLVSLIGILEYLGLMPLWIPSTGRPSSTFGFRNLAALYIIASIPFAGLLGVKGQCPKDRILGKVAVALAIIFIIYIRGRASWVGFSCALVLNAGLWFLFARLSFLETFRRLINRRNILIGVGILLCIATLTSLPSNFSEKHTQRFDEKKANISSAIQSITKEGGDRGRLKMWRYTLNMIADAPILGRGLGNWEYFYPLYDKGDMVSPKNNPLRPHNDFLWLWAETGLVGLGAFLFLLGSFYLTIIRQYQKANTQVHHPTLFACGLSVAAIVTTGSFDFPWERVTPYLFFWLSFAIIGWITFDSSQYQHNTCKTIFALPLLSLACLIISLRLLGFDYYYIRAYKAFLLQDHANLVPESYHASKFGPFDHQIFMMQGEGHLKLGQFEQARISFSKCLQYHPNFANAYSSLGLVHHEWGKQVTNTVDKEKRFRQAIKHYHSALDIIPNHYVALYNMGISFDTHNQPDSAIKYYTKAYGHYSDYSKAAHNLGVIYKNRGQLDSALVYYQNSLKANPPTLESLFNLGNIYIEYHDFAKSAEAYTKFIQNFQGDPTFIDAAQQALSESYNGLGVQAEQKNNLEEALEYYSKAAQILPNIATAWFNMGNVYRKQKALQKAQEAYQKAFANDTANVNLLNNLALTYSDLGNYGQAITIYEQALQLHPTDPILNLNAGNTYAAVGGFAKAKAAYQNFLKHWQGDPKTAAQVRNLIKTFPNQK